MLRSAARGGAEQRGSRGRGRAGSTPLGTALLDRVYPLPGLERRQILEKIFGHRQVSFFVVHRLYFVYADND